MELEFEPDWGELTTSTEPKHKSRRKPRKTVQHEESSITTRSVVDDDDFFRAAKALVQANDLSLSRDVSGSDDLEQACMSIKLAPPLSAPLLAPPPLLPPPPKRSTWAVLGGHLPDISVLENRLLALQENRLHPRPKTVQRVSRERDMGVDLCFAAHSGDVEAAEALLENRADPNFIDFSRRAPLHLAASAGCVPIISLLLQFGAQLSLVGGTSRLTALHFAAEAGHEEVVQLLCGRGAEVDALSFAVSEFAPVPTGHTPLCVACERGHYEAVVALCEARADVHATFGSGARTPLHLAASNNQLTTPQIVSYLVARGADHSLVRDVPTDTRKVSSPSLSPDPEALRPLRSPDEDDDDLGGSDSGEEQPLERARPDQTSGADSDDELEVELEFLSLWDHPSSEIRAALQAGLLDLRKNLDYIFLTAFAPEDLNSVAAVHILDYLCAPVSQNFLQDENEELVPTENDSYESLWE